MSERATDVRPCPSPCVGICRLRPGERVCEGCFRSVSEIGEWTGANDTRRHEICAAAEARRAAADSACAVERN